MDLAFPEGPPDGAFLVIGARADQDLSILDPQRTAVQQPNFPDHRDLSARGLTVSPQVQGDFETTLVILPRAKADARARIAQAARQTRVGGAIWIDGQKTDGVDAILKDIRNFALVDEVHSKVHGKIFRVMRPGGDWLPNDWTAVPRQIAPEFQTWPGVFSADGIDPGSAMLVNALPDRLPTRMVDLGAGWGYLAARSLTRPGLEVIHLVEADHDALGMARRNIDDPRAQFHWADARDFALSEPVNGVIMNPPFHSGREADPGLGAAFIATAARLLTGAGKLWMVSNRHLPYEAVLNRHFAKVSEIGGDTHFKVIEASGAGRGTVTPPKKGSRR